MKTHITIMHVYVLVYLYTHFTVKIKSSETKMHVTVQSLAGSGRLLLRPCLVTLVGATHYAEDTTQEERVNTTSINELIDWLIVYLEQQQ